VPLVLKLFSDGGTGAWQQVGQSKQGVYRTGLCPDIHLRDRTQTFVTKIELKFYPPALKQLNLTQNTGPNETA